MNILFIGSTNSILSANLARKLNENPTISVDAVFSSNDKENEQKYSYKYHNIYYYKFSNASKIYKFNGLLNIVRLIIRVFLLKKYDIIQLHSINPWMLFLMPLLKFKSKKIVSTVWGSDFDRGQNIGYFKFVLKHSDLVTCTNDNFYSRLKLLLDNPNKEIKVLPFMLQILDELDNLKGVTKQQIKTNLGFSPEKLIIGCGTNLRKVQHHLEIIEEIGKVNDMFTKSILVLIQMTYGPTDEEYLSEIENKLSSLGIEYIILSQSLSDKEVAMVRRATDLLIQVQNHDQFSGAMVETFYAENIVITGSWLPYSILDKEGAYYFKVDKISELSRILVDCVNNFDSIVENTKQNPEIISKIAHHGRIVDEWQEAYKSIL